MLEQRGKALVVDVGGTSNDISNLLIKLYKAAPEPKPRIVIFTMQRSTFTSASFNTSEFLISVEKACDGKIQSTKYNGSSLLIPRPWIIILSNNPIPATWISNEMLTDDRWRQMVLPPLSAEDLQQISDFKALVASASGRPIVALPGFT
jgi:hypothetical protein